MQQQEEDSALPFAEIEEINQGNIQVGFNHKRMNSMKKEEQTQMSNQQKQSDFILSSYKKHNIHQVQAQNQQQKNVVGERWQSRNIADSTNQSVPILPRINAPQNISQEMPQQRYSQNTSQNDSQYQTTQNYNNAANKKQYTPKSNTQLPLSGLNYQHKQMNPYNSYALGTKNYPNTNLQINSAKFQKNIFKAITSSTSSPSVGLTFTQRVDTLSYPLSNYQMQINQNDHSSLHKKNFRSTMSQFNSESVKNNVFLTNASEISRDGQAVINTDPSNSRSLIQSKIKEQTHDIHKIISPNAYKVLKMKQIKSSDNSDSNHQNQLNSTQMINKQQSSPEKKRFSSQVMDQKNKIEGENIDEVYRIQEEGVQSIKTLKDLKDWKQNGLDRETMQDQVDKLKLSIQKLQVFPRKTKNVCSISSLQDLVFQESQQSQLTIQYEKYMNNQQQNVVPQIQVSNIVSDEQTNKAYLSSDKHSSLNPFLSVPSFVSQFNNSDNGLNESALLTQDKVSLIKEMNQKNSNRTNFYGQFISRCLEQSQMEMNQTPLKKSKKKEMFETDLEKIKVSSQLLDIIDKQVFLENELTENPDQSFPQSNSDSNQTQILNGTRSPRKKQILNPKQKEKLFQVLAESDKIVVHTSQNKDLMVPSERKDVVRLAQWLEDMLEKIYNIKELDFYEYFESMQLVCSACMSELIRQINLSVQERGQLVKRVWESILNLMKQAFEQVTTEKIDNEKNLKDEIKHIHKMYLKKLDEYLPEIETYKKKLEQKEQQNKRVVLEFRYLRKKDTKLEKYLKLAKKDLRQVEEEYQKLDQDYQKFKKSYEQQDQYYQQTIANLKQVHKQSQLFTTAISFNKNQQNDPSQQLLTDHMKTYQEVTTKAKKGFDTFNQNFDLYNNDLQQLHENYIKDLKILQKDSSYQIDEIEQIEENLYGKKGEVQQILQLDERIVEEIEGSDGITLIIGHCSTQTGPDLLKMTHQSVDTSTLIQLKERTTQTFVTQIDVKEIQTPAEWMQNIGAIKSPRSNTVKSAKGTKLSKFQSMIKMDSQVEVEDDDPEIQKQREQIDQQEQKKLEQMKQLIDMTEDQEIEAQKKFQELPFVKQFLIDSPMLQQSGLLVNWKDEKKGSKQFLEGTFQDYLEDDNVSEESDESNDDIKVPQLNIPDASQRRSKLIHESLSQTINNKVEKDLDDLHTLVMSRTSYVTSICEKIIHHSLLIENEFVTPQMIQQFIDDSKQIILEEHSRLQRIWERSKKGIIDQVKSKIMIAEKDAEIQEVQNDKELVEQQIKYFRKEIHSLEDKKNEIQNNTDNTVRKKTSQSFNSLEDITDEDEIYDVNMSSMDEDDNLSDGRSPTESLSSLKNDTSTLTLNEGSGQKQDTSTSKNRKSKLDSLLPINLKRNSTISKKPIALSTDKSSNSLAPPSNMSNSTKLSPPPVLSQAQNASAQKKPKKKQTLNPLNRVSISLIEAVQVSKQQQKPDLDDKKTLAIDRRFIEINKKKENSPSISILMPNSTIMNTSTINVPNTLNWLKTINMKKKKLQTTSASPNADSAAFFFNKIAFKIMNKEFKTDGKTVILKQQNVLKDIQNIYQDKIKLFKNSEDEANGGSRTLNIVTYDYFKNKYGFKKLMEQKLKQFLDSCMYHSINFKIRIFTKLYGINKIMNYDFEDFDFFTRMMVFLEDGSTAQHILANIYPINRVLEAIYRNFETKIPASEMLRLKQEIENMKISDSTTKQKNKFAIDADHALDIILQALIEQKKICIQNIQSVYLAGDINCDQVIAFDEYLTLFRHFESDSFDMLSVTKFYYMNCDLLDRFTNQRIMSFQKFTLTSVQGDLFTKEIQDAYAARIEPFDRIKNIESLQKLWEDKKDVIRLRFVKNNQYTILYRQMIKRIDDYFSLKKEERKSLEKNTTWFVYRLLDDESKRVMTDSLIESFIPTEFNVFTNFTANYIKKLCLNI